MIINLLNMDKIYKTKDKNQVVALNKVNISFKKTGLTFILGPSGSGKSTLLNVIGGLDEASSGKVEIDKKELGKDISYFEYRRNYVGFVFQEYNLLDDLNVFDNISLAVTYKSKEERIKFVEDVLRQVGMEGYSKRRTSELSGGEKQRVAIARALVKNSKILLCDEPTGNLDSDTSKEIFDILANISRDKLVIIVSHNSEMANKYAERIIEIKDGIIEKDTINKVKDKEEKSLIDLEHNNKISFGYKLKYGFINLFSHKFKTIISFLLLFLSILVMCVTQICLSFNSEKIIANTVQDENSAIVIKNGFKNGSVSNMIESETLKGELSFIDDSLYANGYKANYATLFVLTHKNIDLVDSKEFYFKEELDENTAYVTDYFVDITCNDINFVQLPYNSYSDLNGKQVIYKDHLLFTIAGIIKTDYKEYFNVNGSQKENHSGYDDVTTYNKDATYKKKYIYGGIYLLESTFDGLYVDNNSVSFSEDTGYSIEYTNSSASTRLGFLEISNIQRANPIFYMENGKFGAFNKTDSKEQDVEEKIVSNNEIIISGDLYNKIFNENINWQEFYRLYSIGVMEDTPLQNSLPHLNEEITITINDDNINLELKNKVIVGVSTAYSVGKTDHYVVYATTEGSGLTNQIILSNFVSEINIASCDNFTHTIEKLRDFNVVVAGSIASIIYEKEYAIQQMNYFLIAVSVILSILSIISIFNLINNKIRDKKKEIGILMAIGLKKGEVNFIFLISIASMLVISWLLTLVTLGISTYCVNNMLLVNPFSYIQYFGIDIITVVVLILTGIILLLASIYPLIKITNKKPIDIIKN